MQDIMIIPGVLAGGVKVPPSKSICHRAVICAGLSPGKSTINNVTLSEDIEATVEAMKSLGAVIEKKTGFLEVDGVGKLKAAEREIDCHESGSTLRFLVPLAAAAGGSTAFHGRGKLAERPLNPYYEIFDMQGIEYETRNGKLPLVVQGRLRPGEYRLSGSISSQFISGLLFALPILDGDSRITITTELESKPYVDLTIDALKHFSIDVENNGYNELIIKGNQRYRANDCVVEGDYSQAAFWLAAGTLGADIACMGLKLESLQGDKVIMDIIESMGGKIVREEAAIKALPSKMYGTAIDASQCPDLVPVLAVLAALSCGTTSITNAERLRLKESDRLAALVSELGKLGADIDEKKDGLIIRGKEFLKGGTVDSWNDHRIAMALAVASLRCKEPVVIKGADSVRKSYPDFWEHFRSLGGNTNERSLG